MKIGKIDSLFINRHLEFQENVLFVIHKHWVEFIGPFVKWIIIGVIVPFFAYWLYPSLKVYTTIGLIFVLIMMIYDFLDWYMDVIILTDQNLIHYEWNGFFHNLSTRMAYMSIQSVGHVSTGIGSSVFDYGDLIISRDSGDIVFANTKNPRQAEQEVLSAQNQVLAPAQQIDPHNLKNLLSELVAEHVGNTEVKKMILRRNQGFGNKRYLILNLGVILLLILFIQHEIYYTGG